MKKLALTALFMFTVAITFAQTTNTIVTPPYQVRKVPKFKGGLMISPAITWMQAAVDNQNINKIQSPGAKLGFSYGLVGDFFFNNNYGIGANLRITSFNEEFKYFKNADSLQSIDRTLHLQYLEIPVTLKMRTNEIGYVKYFAQFGFMPAILLGARADINEYDRNNNSVSSNNGLNVNSSVNLFMLYSVVGIGAEYNLGGSTNIIVSLSWNNGFTNIWNRATNVSNPDPYTNSNFSTPVENISLNLGVLF